MISSDFSRAYFETPLGTCEVSGSSLGVSAVGFVRRRAPQAGGALPRAVREGLRQLRGYFQGARRGFSFRVKITGSDFERRVLRALLKIRYGRKISYRELARRVGSPGAARAVGNALAKNKLLVVIPCHRVVTSRGALGGYSAGTAKKGWLLKHETLSRLGSAEERLIIKT
jgi:methylated-DNA-[protein]-cysteine S-methyltransferase